MGRRLARLREYLRLSRSDEIARRYFVINGFDGALAILGVITGAFIVGAAEPRIIISAGFGASLAMGVSGAWGAYMAERAERTRRLKDLQEALFTDLSKTVLERASAAAALTVAMVDALSPVLTSAITLAPFVLALFGIIPSTVALVSALVLNAATLFLMGVFLGRLSRTSMIRYGTLMVLPGIVTIVLVLLLRVAPPAT